MKLPLLRHAGACPVALGTGLTIALVSAIRLPAAVLVADADRITGFELHQTGAIWWRNQGLCGGEFTFDGLASYQSNFKAATDLEDFQRVAADCQLMPDAGNNFVRDESYLYLFSAGKLWKKALNADVADPLLPVFGGTAPSLPAGQQGSFLLRDAEWLYWGEHTGASGALQLKRVRRDGTGAESFVAIAGAGAPVLRMKRFTYESGAIEVEAFAILLTNGRLYLRKVTGPTVTTTLLANGIADFAVDLIGARGSEVPYLYAAEGSYQATMTSEPGRLLRINGGTGASQTLYTAAAHNQVLAVEIDPPLSRGGTDNLYISVGLIGDSLVPLEDFAILRNAMPGVFGTYQPIVLAGGGPNLRSNGHRLHYLASADGVAVNLEEIRDLSTDAPPLELDYAAIGVEITQFSQNPANDQPLVANKAGTFARGYATMEKKPFDQDSFFPSAQLHVWVNNVALPGSPFSPLNSAVVTAEDDLAVLRTNINTSFLFELPRLPPGNLTAAFTVNELQSELETDSAPYLNNTWTIDDPIPVFPGVTPCLVMVPLKTPYGTYTTYDSTLANIIRRAESLLPIEEFDLRGWASLLDGHNSVSGTFFIFPFGGVDSDDPQDNAALDAVDCLRENSSLPGGCDLSHWVGMVHPGVDNFGGLGRRPGFSSIVNMSGGSFSYFDRPFGGTTLAHELGHNYGLQHVFCNCDGGASPKSPNIFYPGNFCSLEIDGEFNYVGFDPIRQRPIRQEEAGDLMSYACDTWPSTYTWNHIYSVSSFLGSLSAVGPQLAGINLQDVDPVLPDDAVLFVAGALNTNTHTASFGTFLQMAARQFPLPRVQAALEESEREATASNPVAIRFLDLGGALLLESALPLEETTDGPDEEFSFTHYFRFPEATRRVQLVRGPQVFAERVVSASAPVVTLDPLVLDPVNQLIHARWQATDADAGPLVFWLYYSPDNGASWQALSLNYPHASAVLDTRRWPGSSQGRLRVVASDGVLTGVAVSELFALPNRLPAIIVSGLAEGERIPYGERRRVSLMALDPEDGRSGVTVQSFPKKVQGPDLPATGNDVAIENFDIGEYELTITATDRAGGVAQTSRRFEILPPAIPEGPEPVLDGAAADAGYRNALFIQIPATSGSKIPVRLVRSNGWLYVAFANLPKSIGRNQFKAGLRLDVDADGSVTPQPGDRGFFVRESGDYFQEAAVGGAMVTTLTPAYGFEPLIAHGAGTWNAEMRVAENLLGGADQEIRLMIEAGGSIWPADAEQDSPATWSRVWLGASPPEPEPRLPPVDAGEDIHLAASAGTLVALQAGHPFTPASPPPLIFSWLQTGGPPVTLTNTSLPYPAFIAGPITEVTEYRFTLTLSNGVQTSEPDEVVVKLYPVTPFTPPPPRVAAFEQGLLSGSLRATPGERFFIQASGDFNQWLNIYTNTADAFGTLDFIDPAAAFHPRRFYRGTRP